MKIIFMENKTTKMIKSSLFISLAYFVGTKSLYAIDQNKTNLVLQPHSQRELSKQIVPKVVYRATVTQPNLLFLTGFERVWNGNNRKELYRNDLSYHLIYHFLFPELNFEENSFLQTQNPSSFVSTTSNREIAYQSAINILNSYENSPLHPYYRRDFYIYEIVPRENFISVADTYERELQNEITNSNKDKYINLRMLNTFYNSEQEYAALGSIPAQSLISATLFRYNLETKRFEQLETISNSYFDANLRPALHSNDYPIGTIPNSQNVNFMYRYSGCEVPFRSESQVSSIRLKRESNESRCNFSELYKRKQIKMPKELFKNNAIQIQVKDKIGNSYCLVPYKRYIYVDDCNIQYANNNWLYTEFGQLIAEINDGENDQYFCLSEQKNQDSSNYLKMEICDLTNDKQHWSFIENNLSQINLISQSGKNVKLGSNYYLYLEDNHTDDNLLILSHNKINENISFPLIQFEVSFIMKEKKRIISFRMSEHYILHDYYDMINKKYRFEKLTLYPKYTGTAYFDEISELEEYRNFYNAHNHSLFSNYGNDNKGSQVCYYSTLDEEGGNSKGDIKHDYCSNQDELEVKFQWFFQKERKGTQYEIFDNGKNIMRKNSDYSYAYTANEKGWTDDTSYLQNFTLNSPASIYADKYSIIEKMKEKLGIQIKNESTLFAFASLYDHFSGIYKIDSSATKKSRE